GAVVRHDGENGVLEERFILDALEKIADGPVRIFYGERPVAFLRIFGDAPGRVGVGLVIRHGEERDEERPFLLRERAKLLDAAVEEVLIADAPDRGERRMRKVLFLDEPVV